MVLVVTDILSGGGILSGCNNGVPYPMGAAVYHPLRRDPSGCNLRSSQPFQRPCQDLQDPSGIPSTHNHPLSLCHSSSLAKNLNDIKARDSSMNGETDDIYEEEPLI